MFDFYMHQCEILSVNVGMKNNDENPTWFGAEVLKLVDVHAASSAIKSLIEACSGSLEELMEKRQELRMFNGFFYCNLWIILSSHYLNEIYNLECLVDGMDGQFFLF